MGWGQYWIWSAGFLLQAASFVGQGMQALLILSLSLMAVQFGALQKGEADVFRFRFPWQDSCAGQPYSFSKIRMIFVFLTLNAAGLSRQWIRNVFCSLSLLNSCQLSSLTRHDSVCEENDLTISLHNDAYDWTISLHNHAFYLAFVIILHWS